MQIFYGGLKFEVVKLLDFIRQPVLDDAKVDYLFTKFTINCIALCNSQQDFAQGADRALGISYIREGSPAPATSIGLTPPGIKRASDNGSPGFNFRSNTIVTDNTIRHWLKVPRRQLDVADSGGNIILRSPKPTFYVDAHNGPKVSVYSIQEVMGDSRTFVVHFQVETYINECEEAEGRSTAGLLAPLVSNRFSQYHSLDEDYFLTVVTQGVARFRTDLVYNQLGATTGVNPDSLRPYLFLPIPYGFKRENIQISGDPNVSGLHYQFTDVQKVQQFVAGNYIAATRVEAGFREVLYTGNDPLGVVLGTVDRIYNYKWVKNAVEDHDAARKPPTPGAGSAGTTGGSGRKGP